MGTFTNSEDPDEMPHNLFYQSHTAQQQVLQPLDKWILVLMGGPPKYWKTAELVL